MKLSKIKLLLNYFTSIHGVDSSHPFPRRGNEGWSIMKDELKW